MIEESSEECLKRCAGTTIVVGEEILLAKRCEFWRGKPAPLPGFWSIFAGAVESGESTMNCAIRELREESCIDIEIHQLQYINDLIDDVCEKHYLDFSVPDFPFTFSIDLPAK